MSNEHGDNFYQEELTNTEINSIRKRISSIAQMPLSYHGEEFEAVHASLQKALSEIDGL